MSSANSPKYKVPMDEILHALEVAGAKNVDIQDFSGSGDFEDNLRFFFDGFAKLAADKWAPTNLEMHLNKDMHPKLILGENGEYNRVELHSVHKDILREANNLGLSALPLPEEYDGFDTPWTLCMPLTEIFNAANTSAALQILLTQGAAEALAEHGNQEIRDMFLRKMASAEIAGTMLLTEPEAGSDLAHVALKAAPQTDGTYHLSGASKIFITYGEQDLTKNIAHLVLARTGAKDLGTKGISLFVVPKFMVDAQGNSTGQHNGIEVSSIYEKMGIHGSPTCQMEFGGTKGPAVGYLVGELNMGMNHMFVMMARARINVGMQGVGIAERAYQAGMIFAENRKQGTNVATGEKKVSINQHPDVRRMLMVSKAKIAAARMTCYYAAVQLDKAKKGDKEAESKLALFTPMVKAGPTDMAVEVASEMMQVAGGMGYVEETGFAQMLADVRITPIYEGTNGIQALDLVGRQLAKDYTGPGQTMFKWINSSASKIQKSNEVHEQVLKCLNALSDATQFILGKGQEAFKNPSKAELFVAPATDYLRLFEIAAGGVLMLESIKVAQEKNNPILLQQSCELAEIYAHNVVAQYDFLLHKIKNGADAVLKADMQSFKNALNL
ncbi:MAG: acyl-CoA dehydrogenase [Alphaproteobacteria bacterium]|nr:acyl-CoA dehydrogenase [Alphaproteobacteria bacterium]